MFALLDRCGGIGGEAAMVNSECWGSFIFAPTRIWELAGGAAERIILLFLLTHPIPRAYVGEHALRLR